MIQIYAIKTLKIEAYKSVKSKIKGERYKYKHYWKESKSDNINIRLSSFHSGEKITRDGEEYYIIKKG